MGDTTRRTFIKHTLKAGLACTVPHRFMRAASELRIRGANDDIRVAVIGFNGHGKSHINNYLKIRGTRLVALCDADRAVLDRQVTALKKRGLTVTPHVDLRTMLDDGDIDAVSTATPNHWHALVTVWACQAGKDVCVEKPVSHSIWEGRKMVEAARKHDRVVQADLDLRSNEGVRAAVRYVREGNLGKVLLVRGCCYKRRRSMGKVTGAGPIPPSLDYDLWCGPAPKGPLRRKKLHYDWHWVWATGCGELGNNGPHQLDLCRWVLGETGLPRRVMSLGGRFGYDDDGETPNTQIACYDYASAPLIYEVRGLGRTAGDGNVDAFRAATRWGTQIKSGNEGPRPVTGVIVVCEQGYVDLAGRVAYDRKGAIVKRFEGGGLNAQANFIRAVRSRRITDLRTDILEGHLSTSLSHLGNISQRVGRRVSPGELRERLRGDKAALETLGRFQAHLAANDVNLTKEPAVLGPWLTVDSTKERFVGTFAEEANRLVKRDYRKPFIIPEHV